MQTHDGKDDDILFKIILVGDQGRKLFTYYHKLNIGVGKSSILLRYTQNQFRQDYNVTIGVEFCSKTVEIDSDTSVKLQIWDTVRIYFISIY